MNMQMAERQVGAVTMLDLAGRLTIDDGVEVLTDGRFIGELASSEEREPQIRFATGGTARVSRRRESFSERATRR